MTNRFANSHGDEPGFADRHRDLKTASPTATATKTASPTATATNTCFADATATATNTAPPATPTGGQDRLADRTLGPITGAAGTRITLERRLLVPPGRERTLVPVGGCDFGCVPTAGRELAGVEVPIAPVLS